ncbi:MAG: hypothetical protein M1813_004293 [Trichoglossum hirsutum]|nr:MAG: hypothetical protein M1813_004293 [Trichoglossum hirsutum]
MDSSTTTQSSTHNLATSRNLFQTAQAMLPQNIQMGMRERLASGLIREYERDAQRNPQYLRDAIEHSEMILRWLPRDSPERPEHLSRLSYAHMSEYVASRRAIDESVRCGRLAREEAVATGLPERDLGSYCEILNNVGDALSHRCQITPVTPAAALMETRVGEDSSSGSSSSAADDLDEAIEYTREIKMRTTREIASYSATLLNLASRLARRYSMCGDPASHAEAVELLQELQSLSPMGSAKSGLTIMLFGQLAVDKFNKTDTLEDLCEALKQTTEGIDKLPQDYEGKPACFNQIANLYSSRYKKTSDMADLRNAAHYSNMTLEIVPVSHGVKGGYLLGHMRLLRDFANATMSVQDVEEAISKGHRHLIEMRNEYPERHSCREFYGNVLGRRYVLSRKLEDLVDAISHVEKLWHDYNDKVNESGVIPPVDGSLIHSLSTKVRKLSLVPPGRVRDAATEKLYDQIATVCESHDFINGLLGIGKEFVTLLGVYVDAAHDRETIADDEAHERAEELQLKEKAELE